MQMNQALFMLNGKSGYVLQPSIMRDDHFDPFDRHTLRGVEPVTLAIEVQGEKISFVIWLRKRLFTFKVLEVGVFARSNAAGR